MFLPQLAGPLRTSRRSSGFVATVLVLFSLSMPGASAAQQPRTLSGMVVDAETGQPVADVLVRIETTALQTITDGQGRFQIAGIPVGSPRLLFRHLAYGEHGRTLVVGDRGALDFRVRISRQAIELDPLEVEVRSGAFGDRVASGNSIDLIERPAIEIAALRGESLVNILGSQVRGVRAKGACLEYRFPISSGGIGLTADDEMNLSCREMAVYLDGIRVQESATFLMTMQLDDLESIEVLSPSEAGVRYADADRGVLLLESRRGTVPNAPTAPTVAVTGFGWSESQPYRWARVLGVSLAANAAGVGLAYAGLLNCRGQDPALGSTQCGEMPAVSAGLMTGTVGSLLATWAGTTPATRGRTVPSLAVGVVTATSGYMLFLQGENRGSEASRIAGAAILAVGTPFMLTLTDRVFRRLR